MLPHGVKTRSGAPFHAYNPAMKECPMCGETMKLSVREVKDGAPGGGQRATRTVKEWICPECDYFEDSEPGEG